MSEAGGIGFGTVGHVVITQHLTINNGAHEAPGGASYLAQVKHIAPSVLQDREAEIEELAAFCLEPGLGPYVWWQAGPWSGKSALMSTFVLRAPPRVSERTRFISFFITKRFAAQNTRQAFNDVVLQQLAALTGQELPAVLPDATREGYLLNLLDQAAYACQQAGERLVLLVDGLDEDGGVTTGPEARSIAGLLPADPPAGMRVIVAGRPNPPVPADVPDWHPLRDPTIVRLLSPSQHARDAKRLSRQELRRLLRGNVAEQGLLGFLSAARGGLSAPDLAELAEIPLWEIEEILHAAAGRTFNRLPSRWTLGGPDVYLLGHEELQAAALSYLGSRLPAYRDRLHTWAENYKERGWPSDTPEYLLFGYQSLLSDLHDLPRIISCALDQSRHELLLNVTGIDAAALTEIRGAIDLIAAQDEPDLSSALALAFYRDQLADRNTGVPDDLPAAWAALGQATRAEALATSVPDLDRRAVVLATVAAALTGTGQQAAAVAGQAAAAGSSVTDPELRARTLAQVAKVLAQARQVQHATIAVAQAQSAVDLIADRSRRDGALVGVAVAWGWVGDHHQADAAVKAISDSHRNELALGQVATALAEAGQFHVAQGMARSISDSYWRALALAKMADALIHAGELHRAKTVADEAEAAARSTLDSYQQPRALRKAAGALAMAGRYRQAEAAARLIADPGQRVKALAELAEVLADAGQLQQAEKVAQQAKTDVGLIDDAHTRARALAKLARALARLGLHPDAGRLTEQALAEAARVVSQRWGLSVQWAGPVVENAVRGMAEADLQQQVRTITASIPTLHLRALALANVAAILSEAQRDQDADHAAELAAAAADKEASMSRAANDADEWSNFLAKSAWILAKAGHLQAAADLARQAAEAARSVTGQDQSAVRLADVASQVTRILGRAGKYEEAQAAARLIADPDRRERVFRDLATEMTRTLGKAGEYQEAEAAAHLIVGHAQRAQTLVELTCILASGELVKEAGKSARHAETAASRVVSAADREPLLAEVAAAFARAGLHQEAAAAVRSITNPGRKNEALGEVAEKLTGAGIHQQAIAAACLISDSERRDVVLASVAEGLARAGQHEHAEAAARTVTDLEWRSMTLARTAEALARKGICQQAEAVAGRIPVTHLRVKALNGIARVFSESRLRKEAGASARRALIEAETMAEPSAQAYSLAETAGILAKIGLAGEAAVAADQAETVAKSIPSRVLQNRVLAEVATVLALEGHPKSQAVACAITDPCRQAQLLAEVAHTLAEAGQHQQAATCAEKAMCAASRIEGPRPLAQALARVAGVLAETGHLEQAKACARGAADAVGAVGDAYMRTQLATEAVETLVKAGLHQQAIDMAGSIPDAYRRSLKLVDMARAIAQAGDHQHASAAIRAITNSSKRALALAEVVRTLAGAGLRQEAKDTADSMADIDWHAVQPEAAAEAARCLASAGQYDQAASAAHAIVGAYLQAKALVEVAATTAERGEIHNATAAAEQAQKITSTIDDQSHRIELLHKVAIALAKAGQRERAETAAAQIADPYWRTIALADVVATLITIGDCQQALAAAMEFEAAASQVTEPDRRAQALVGVAKTLAGAGLAAPARKLSAAACKFGRWTTVASSVLAVDAEAFVTLARRIDAS